MNSGQGGAAANQGSVVLQNMGMFLLGQVFGSDRADFEFHSTGAVHHLRVRNSHGDVVAHVVGNDIAELGRELALAILHDVPVDRLLARHREPSSSTPLPLHKEK